MNHKGPASERWKRNDNKKGCVELLLFVAICALVLGTPAWYVFSAKQESATYNRLTGAETTWWDALWVELRVQDQPRKQQ